MNLIEGNLTAQGMRFCIVGARFNQFIVDQLVAGARDIIVRHGGSDQDIDLVWVPGAFEMPLALEKVAASGKYDAVVAVGAVIRGGTPHFDYVAGECVKGIAQMSWKHGLPIAFGVLTVDSIDQAIERAGTKAGNKGGEAALSAIEMVNLLRSL